jgi:hypothetical protein
MYHSVKGLAQNYSYSVLGYYETVPKKRRNFGDQQKY